jgi:molecular chaperone GrpE
MSNSENESAEKNRAGAADPVRSELDTLKTEMNEVEAELGSLRSDLADQKGRYVRLAADFDNFRKRAAQEADRRATAQKEAFIRELLPIVDNLERALASEASPAQLREGVQMTLQQLRQLLRKHGIEREETQGQVFDPNRHEAIAERHDPAQPDHAIVETFQPGYRRGQEVFRPAKVAVNTLASHEI